VRLALVPRTTEFYDLFTRAGANALEAARKAEARFREFPSTSTTQEDVKAIETAGDDITRELMHLLNTQYITPFDREDIYQLATALDDVVDLIEEASALLELYRIEQPAPHAVHQCRLLVGAVEHLARALVELKGMKGIEQELIGLKQLEDEGDTVVRDAIAELFSNSHDALLVIRWKDIHEALEDAIDACETVANVIGNVVVKNA
jgi:predicted phosphate transport protein (TIGR00153 family)